MTRHLRRSLTAAAVTLAALLASTAVAGAADTVPVLNGGQAHWSGSATRTYHGASNDGNYATTDDLTSTIAFDTRILLPGRYPDDPPAPVSPQGPGFVLAQSYKDVLGSGRETVTAVCVNGDPDCQPNLDADPTANRTCTWTERTNRASAGMLAPHQWVIAPAGISIHGNTLPGDYSCADQYNLYDPTPWDCRTVTPEEADVCGTVFAFPTQPAEGDGAVITRTFDHASTAISCGRVDDQESCVQTGRSTLTVSCALCVTRIAFQQPDLPGRGWTDVPPTGTFDGNRVRVTATIHNATPEAITVPVRFRDLTTDRDLPVATGGEQPAAQVSFPANADTTVVLDWNTDGFAWYLPHKPDPHKIAVLTPYGGARRDLAVRPKPVMLVHGFNATPATWAGYPDLFEGARSDWLARTANGMDTDPATGNTIYENSRILARDIEHLRDELDAEHVDLVVHSMGGLISRSYLHYLAPDDPDRRPVVGHLVMLGTPNEGSNCADQIVALQVGWGMVKGRSRHDAGNPTFELMPEYVRDIFDRAVTNTRGTKLSVLAGHAPLSVQAAMAALCGLGTPNDMVVSQESAFWTLTDTATQSPLMHIDMTHDARAFNSFVVPHLEDTPEGPVPGTGLQGASAAAHAATAARASHAARVKPVAAPAMTLATGVSVPAHRTRRVALRVSSGKQVAALLLGDRRVSADLVDSRHKRVARTPSTDGIGVLAARVRRHGRWTIVLRNRGGAAVRVGVGATVAGDRFQVIPKLRTTGKGAHRRLRLTVTVRGAGGRARAKAITRALDGTGRSRPLKLRRHGSRFAATPKPLRNGTVVVVVVRGRHGTRTATVQAPPLGAPKPPAGAPKRR